MGRAGVNRIFFRFFMLVMLSITAATFVVYFVMSRLFGDPLEDIARRQAAIPSVLRSAGSPVWFSTMAVSSKSAASRAASCRCHQGVCRSNDSPYLSSRAKPRRHAGSAMDP